MQKSGAERLLMGVSMCISARQTVLSSFPDNLSDTDKKIKLLRRYYSHDFDAKELRRIEEYFIRNIHDCENEE